MTEVTQYQSQAPKMGAFDASDDQMVKYLGLDPRDPKTHAVVAVCRHYGFDPLLKHVIVIPGAGPYITRDGLLNAAHRSGQFDGMDVVQDPTYDQQTGEWVAKVAVYRKDMSRPFTFPGRYPSSGKNKQYAPEMALKTAEAHALRRAFDITGLPTEDEYKANTASQRQTVTADQFLPPKEEPAPATPEEPAHTPPTQAQFRSLYAVMGDSGVDTKDKAQIYAWLGQAVGREVASGNDLTKDEASRIIDYAATTPTPEEN